MAPAVIAAVPAVDIAGVVIAGVEQVKEGIVDDELLPGKAFPIVGTDEEGRLSKIPGKVIGGYGLTGGS